MELPSLQNWKATVTKRKSVAVAEEYKQHDFLNDTAPARTVQIKPSLSTTKFHEGFYRRPQSQIRQDEARKFEEEYTKTQKQQRHERRQIFLNEKTYSSGYKNPITLEQSASFTKFSNTDQKALRKNYPEWRVHDAAKTYTPSHNVVREDRIRSEGLTITKKNYSVSDMFQAYAALP